jgi:hypothetical protein
MGRRAAVYGPMRVRLEARRGAVCGPIHDMSMRLYAMCGRCWGCMWDVLACGMEARKAAARPPQSRRTPSPAVARVPLSRRAGACRAGGPSLTVALGSFTRPPSPGLPRLASLSVWTTQPPPVPERFGTGGGGGCVVHPGPPGIIKYYTFIYIKNDSLYIYNTNLPYNIYLYLDLYVYLAICIYVCMYVCI